ncbi:MAG TPA: hypothetical protein VG710_01490 [Opitutus sp.]|nr:hypothetical protein [Opitutus sp.]
MESPSLNFPPDEDAALAAMLRAHAPTIADDGFTARVMAALPPAPRGRAAAARWPWIAYVGGGLAGAAVVAFQAAAWSDFVSATRALANAFAHVAAACAEPWLVLAVTLSILSLVISVAFTRPRWRFW